MQKNPQFLPKEQGKFARYQFSSQFCPKVQVLFQPPPVPNNWTIYTSEADKSKDVKANKNVHVDGNFVEKIKNEKNEATDQGHQNGENDTKENGENGKNETAVKKEIKAKAMKVKIKNEENEPKEYEAENESKNLFD